MAGVTAEILTVTKAQDVIVVTDLTTKVKVQRTARQNVVVVIGEAHEERWGVRIINLEDGNIGWRTLLIPWNNIAGFMSS